MQLFGKVRLNLRVFATLATLLVLFGLTTRSLHRSTSLELDSTSLVLPDLSKLSLRDYWADADYDVDPRVASIQFHQERLITPIEMVVGLAHIQEPDGEISGLDSKYRVVGDNLLVEKGKTENIFFLKTHKCGTSTLVNALYLYGVRRRLNFVTEPWKRQLNVTK